MASCSKDQTIVKVVVSNENGIHIRPASIIARCAAQFQSEIELEAEGKRVDARSIFDILLLAATKGTSVQIIATGEDHYKAAHAVAALFREGFPLDPVPEHLA
ncbi:MAG: HPr family phosphocarrier protein [Planctomycetia bacterium]|nr:HPr family phosphocarrier protein [Planctomycetia bacterium]